MNNIPENTLKKQITEILELEHALQEKYTYNSPVSEEELSLWEHETNIKIPESIKDWLRFANGSKIQNNTMVTYELVDFVYRNNDISEDFVIIGNVIGDGQFIGFSKETGKILWEDHGEIHEYKTMKELLEEIIEIL